MKKLRERFSDKSLIERVLKRRKQFYEQESKAAHDELKVVNSISPEMICMLFNKKESLVGFSRDIIF